MCTSPIVINNPSVYTNKFFSNQKISVPCGHCLECESSKQGDWRTRLNYEIDALYKRGGIALLLTFTYNSDNLPHFVCPPLPKLMDYDFKLRSILESRPQCCSYPVDDLGFENPSFDIKRGLYYDWPFSFDDSEYNYSDIPCFNKEHVKQFLNNLKVHAHELFGSGSYKYFWVCEYGSKKCRPHYHCLFMLEPCVNWHDFTELCRSLWNYGFMFPFYDEKLKIYRNEKMEIIPPTLRSPLDGSSYATKYITKDMDFFNNPFFASLEDFLPFWRALSRSVDCKYLPCREFYKMCIDQFPFHLQSKGIGDCILDSLDDNSLVDALQNGILLPKYQDNVKPFYVSLPQYIIQKLLYKSVKSERISRLSGLPLYDKVFTEFGEKYLLLCEKGRENRFKTKAFKFCMSESFFVRWAEKAKLNVSKSLDLLRLFHKMDDRFNLLAKYHFCVSKYPDSLMQHCFATATSPFNQIICDLFILRSHDVRYKKRFCTPFATVPQVHLVTEFNVLRDFHDMLISVMRCYSKTRLESLREQSIKNCKVRRDVCAKYDKSLC